MKPVATAKDLITAPGQTIGDTFRGVGHIFGSAKAAMKATDPHKERVLASVTGGSTARRKFAFGLGVDPNTSFAPLDSELKRVATASAIGETGANVGLSFVAGPAGYAIGAAGTSNWLREALRDKTAAELERGGRKALASMGVSDATMDAFYANAMLSPTDKAIIVEALASGRGRARDLRRRRGTGAKHREGLLLSSPGRTDRGVQQARRTDPPIRAFRQCADAEDRQRHRQHLAGGLSH